MGRVTMMAQCDYYHLVMMCVCYEYIHPPTHPFSIEKEGASHDRFFFLRGKKKGGLGSVRCHCCYHQTPVPLPPPPDSPFYRLPSPIPPTPSPLRLFVIVHPLFFPRLSILLNNKNKWMVCLCLSVRVSLRVEERKKNGNHLSRERQQSRAQLLISLCLFYPLTSS